jgi:hypothetical protein
MSAQLLFRKQKENQKIPKLVLNEITKVFQNIERLFLFLAVT